MELKNGYKVIYDVAKNGERNFYASKTGVFADAEPLLESVKIGDYKLIYEKEGMFYGSTTGIPAADDYCFEAFNKVFVEGTEEVTTAEVEQSEEPTTPNKEAGNETPVEDAKLDEGDEEPVEEPEE